MKWVILLPLISLFAVSCVAEKETSLPDLNQQGQETPQSVELLRGDEITQIAFTSWLDGRDEYLEIYVINSDGTGLNKINTGDLGAKNPMWSPDGGKIVFNSDRNDSRAEIYVVNVDGTGLERLTHNPTDDLYPTWSPDGTQIAFYSSDYTEIPMLYLMDADGSNVQRVSDVSTVPGGLDWSPDGEMIVFNSATSISIMNSDGSGLRDLTPGTSVGISWSPDGGKILFDRVDETGNYDIYVINVDGTGLTRLTSNDLPDMDPDWSPNSSQIAFTCNELDDICVMNSDGSEIVNVTNDAAYDSSPAWQQSVLPSGAIEAAIQETESAESSRLETEAAEAQAAFSLSQMIPFSPPWYEGDISQNVFFEGDHWRIKAPFPVRSEGQNGFGIVTPDKYSEFDITVTMKIDAAGHCIKRFCFNYSETECLYLLYIDAINYLEWCMILPSYDWPWTMADVGNY